MTADLSDPEAKSGCVVKVTVEPGLPIGPLRQKIRLTTNLPHADVIDVPVHGTVASDISIVGKDWDSDRGVLTLGDVKSSEGAVNQLVHPGPGAAPARYPIQRQPQQRSVAAGDAGRAARHQRRRGGPRAARFEVPRGAASVNHLGSQLGKLARVTIETTHPEAKTLPLYVQFAVEP